MLGKLHSGERSGARMQRILPTPTDPKQLLRPSIAGSRPCLAFFPLADQQEGNCGFCSCAARLLPCSLPRSGALRSCCRRSGCSPCPAVYLRCGASGSGRRACLGRLRPRRWCGGCCSPCGRASRGCSLSLRCSCCSCSPCRGSFLARSVCCVAPSCLGRGWVPSARLRGLAGALRACCLGYGLRRCGCGGEWGTRSGHVDDCFTWPCSRCALTGRADRSHPAPDGAGQPSECALSSLSAPVAASEPSG